MIQMLLMLEKTDGDLTHMISIAVSALIALSIITIVQEIGNFLSNKEEDKNV